LNLYISYNKFIRVEVCEGKLLRLCPEYIYTKKDSVGHTIIEQIALIKFFKERAKFDNNQNNTCRICSNCKFRSKFASENL